MEICYNIDPCVWSRQVEDDPVTHAERNSMDKVGGAVAGAGPVGHSSSRDRHTEHKGGRAE